jgi:hypothetical protein
VDVNSFEPLAAGRAKITFGSYEGTGRVGIYNMAGTLVRTLESQGGGPVYWYGDNDSDEPVASGVYLLWIRAGGAEAVRKVAVVR